MNTIDHRFSLSASLLKDKSLERLTIFMIVLITFGFPIIAYASVTIGVPSRPLAIGYRLLMLGLSFFLFFIGITKRPIKLNVSTALLMFFWVVYAIRIIWDISILDVPRGAEDTPFYVYSFAFGNCLLPMLAVSLIITQFNFDVNKLIKAILWILAIQAILIVILLVQKYGLNWKAMLVRQYVQDESGGNVLNPISISRAGGLLFTTVLCFLLFFKNHFFKKLLLYFFLVVGVYLLMAGGSRGPLFASVISVPIILIFYFRKNKLRAWVKMTLFLIPLLIIGLLNKDKFTIQSKDIAAINRLESTVGNSKEEARVIQWRSAWQQFKDNPLVGDRMYERVYNFYPHNIILESLMATGILGSIFLFLAFLMFFSKLFKVFRLLEVEYFIFGILVLVNFLAFMTSGSLYQGVELWVLLATFLAVKIPRQRKPKLRPNLV